MVLTPVNPSLHSTQFVKQFLEGVANHRVWDREVSYIVISTMCAPSFVSFFSLNDDPDGVGFE